MKAKKIPVVPAEYAALVQLLGVDTERLEQKIADAIAAAYVRDAVWLSLQEAADYLKISKRTFARKLKELKIPVSKIFGSLCVYRPDLDALMLAGLIKAAEKPCIPFPSIQAQRKVA